MTRRERKTILETKQTISDYLRPALQALYPPRISGTPKDLAGRLRRLGLLKSKGRDEDNV
jgi:hypothetical protein